MKTHHSRREVDNEVLVIEDIERNSSPLTELSSLSPIPLSTNAPLPRIPEASRADPRTPPTPSLHLSNVPPTTVNGPIPTHTTAPMRQLEVDPPSLKEQVPGVNLEEPGSEPDTPHTVLEPLPALDLGPAPAPTGSRVDDAKPPVSTDKKPKLKGKKKGGPDSQFTMDGTLLDKRLLAVGPDFEVDNDRITHHQAGPNSRATMSQIFGGNPQRMISYPSPEKRRVHGFASALLFPSRNFNPLLPTKIGERGLLFRLDQKLEQWVDNEGGGGPYHLMMHHTSDDYCYFGVYEFVRVDPVTKDEWLAQSPQVYKVSSFKLHTTNSLRIGKGKLGEPCAQNQDWRTNARKSFPP